ncbi:MAG TPA: hypothetical protein VGL77_10215 [Armatimonadota bacterium]|jgi:hypothetical protein
MRRRLLVLILLLVPALCLAATLPTTLRVVDLRHLVGQPELATWLGSLQGGINRQDGTSVVYLIRTEADADLAATLVSQYHLQQETFSPRALLATMKATISGQVRYDAAQPWTRNIALTAAALQPGLVLASAEDLGVPTVLDLRQRWADRRSAYAWALATYGDRVERTTAALAPEDGQLFADLIVARKLLAVDLAPDDAEEAALLAKLIAALPAGGRLLGMPGHRTDDAANAMWKLTALLGAADRTFVPLRNTANLSCLARLPVTRPLLQGRREATSGDAETSLILIYDSGAGMGSSQSLDYATQTLPTLLADPALSELPVGIEVPSTLLDYAPAVYQALIARQRFTAAELIAAPNGDGWTLPMSLGDAAAYQQRSAVRARAADLRCLTLADVGGQAAYTDTLRRLASTGWAGAFVYPVAPQALADRQPRAGQLLPGFCALVGATRVRTAQELHTVLATLSAAPFQVVYLDPDGLPPSALRLLLPEISAKRTLLTPSQAVRALLEMDPVMAFLKAKEARRIKYPKRGQATLRVSTPSTTLTAPTAADAIHVTVRITGATPVLLARLISQNPDGNIGAADLHNDGNGVWSATLPPTLVGGTLRITARVVETGGFGVSLSDALTLTIPVVDSDGDSAEDTVEAYQGSDPLQWDSDHDGLADGYDAHPTRVDRDLATLLPPLTPPADAPYLADAGLSTADAQGRVVPTAGAVRYRIPLQDIPAAPGALHLLTRGPGRVSVNGEPSQALASTDDALRLTDLPLSAGQLGGRELTVTLQAGEKSLTLCELYVTNNPDGPYILPAQLAPAHPPAGVPIAVSAIVYTPHTLQAVRLHYGPDLQHLTTLEMKHVDGTAGAVFGEEIPAQDNGATLIYNIEAEDTTGHRSAGPYAAVPIGRPRKTSIALLGSRDILGDWNATPIWGATGRSLTKGAGTDTAYFRARPGSYTVWLFAQPRQRGIQVQITQPATFTTAGGIRLEQSVPAGSADGWYRLGAFSTPEDCGLHITITPVGAEGYCAYGTLILTQDSQFTPPLAHAGFDWYNSLLLSGITQGQTVTSPLAITVATAGNIDALRLTITQKTASAGVMSSDEIDLPRGRDGSYTLNVRGLNPGGYELNAYGLKLISADGARKTVPLLVATVRFTVPKP